MVPIMSLGVVNARNARSIISRTPFVERSPKDFIPRVGIDEAGELQMLLLCLQGEHLRRILDAGQEIEIDCLQIELARLNLEK